MNVHNSHVHVRAGSLFIGGVYLNFLKGVYADVIVFAFSLQKTYLSQSLIDTLLYHPSTRTSQFAMVLDKMEDLVTASFFHALRDSHWKH